MNNVRILEINIAEKLFLISGFLLSALSTNYLHVCLLAEKGENRPSVFDIVCNVSIKQMPELWTHFHIQRAKPPQRFSL